MQSNVSFGLTMQGQSIIFLYIKKTDKPNTVLQSRQVIIYKMTTQFKLIVILSLVPLLFSCNNAANKSTETTSVSEEVKAPISQVTTKEEQAQLTPDAVLQEFIDGNNRFKTGQTIARNQIEQSKNSASGQYPKAVVLSCIDSRVPVEDIFDQGIGDVFVGRVAGNIVNEDLLGSMEFACKVAGAKLILVLSHQSCGAVKGAIDDVKLGNMTAMLSKIKPAIAISQDFEGDKSSKNNQYVTEVAENNVSIAIKNIRDKSPLLKEMEDKGEIKIVGAYYHIDNAEVEFLK